MAQLIFMGKPQMNYPAFHLFYLIIYHLIRFPILPILFWPAYLAFFYLFCSILVSICNLLAMLCKFHDFFDTILCTALVHFRYIHSILWMHKWKLMREINLAFSSSNHAYYL